MLKMSKLQFISDRNMNKKIPHKDDLILTHNGNVPFRWIFAMCKTKYLNE